MFWTSRFVRKNRTVCIDKLMEMFKAIALEDNKDKGDTDTTMPINLDCAIELPNIDNPYKLQVCEQSNILSYRVFPNISKISRFAQ